MKRNIVIICLVLLTILCLAMFGGPALLTVIDYRAYFTYRQTTQDLISGEVTNVVNITKQTGKSDNAEGIASKSCSSEDLGAVSKLYHRDSISINGNDRSTNEKPDKCSEYILNLRYSILVNSDYYGGRKILVLKSFNPDFNDLIYYHVIQDTLGYPGWRFEIEKVTQNGIYFKYGGWNYLGNIFDPEKSGDEEYLLTVQNLNR